MTEEDKLTEVVKEEAREQLAVVKYSFPGLQCNTNLNLPPTNWLHHLPQCYGMQELPNSLGFSSFRMDKDKERERPHRDRTRSRSRSRERDRREREKRRDKNHFQGQRKDDLDFPDCIGYDVDVVSSAENIKRLLKMPYAFQSPLSLMVHRVGNTILIDDFEIQKYFRRKSEGDWKWLKSFISEAILNNLSEHDRQLLMKGHNANALHDGTLMQKFFAHSISQDDSATDNTSPIVFQTDEAVKTTKLIPTPPSLLLNSPILPEPKQEEKTSRSFNRNVLWTFEDIRMLIGTDMPIFGGDHRPCISLRLRDTMEPINVLTGIDYWLDNLMCNVPEIGMCYHLNGIVQKWELVKTEDLPYLEDSKFSPKVVRNVAQNILAFLKQNATKAGHTYWLFKGPRDDVVKLYDLTTLCSMKDEQAKEEATEAAGVPGSDQNPFTTPVGMLLYKVARNMKMSREKLSPKQAGTIKALLDNCIQLLPVEAYPQIVTSSHYMLSDLYVPTGIDPSAPNFPTTTDTDTESLYDEFDEELEEDSECEETFFDSEEMNRHNVAVQNVQATTTDQSTATKYWKHNARPPPLLGGLEKRCQESLEEISTGLKGLKFFKVRTEEGSKKDKQHQIWKEEQNLNMARSNQPIPLPYEKLEEEKLPQSVNCPSAEQRGTGGGKGGGKKAKKLNVEIQASTDQFLKETSSMIQSWDVHLKLLLLEKACLTYAVLAESFYASEKYGVSLRYIKLALNCQKAVVNHLSSLRFQKCCLLGRAGDCYFQIIRRFMDIDDIREEFSSVTETDKDILKEIQDEIELDSFEIAEPQGTIECLLLASLTCYELAIALSKDKAMEELLGRLGNVQNELGVKYMYHAQEGFNELPDNGKLSNEYRQSIDKSLDYLQRGISTFEKLNDVTNLSLVCSNLGRLHRLQAHLALKELDDCLKLSICAEFYAVACSHYQKALSLLESKKRNPTLWDVITWELSTASYTIAKLYFEAKTAADRNMRDKIIAYLQTALKNCDLRNGPKYEDFFQRTGDVHFMLGFSHEALLAMPVESEKKRKSLIYLTFFHFGKALTIYATSGRFYEFVNVAIFEMDFLLGIVTQAGGAMLTVKMKYLANVSELIDQFVRVLEMQQPAGVEDDERLVPVMLKLEERIKNYFMAMIKYINSSAIKSKETRVAPFKRMFAHLLRTTSGELDVQELSAILLERLQKIQIDLLNSELKN